MQETLDFGGVGEEEREAMLGELFDIFYVGDGYPGPQLLATGAGYTGGTLSSDQPGNQCGKYTIHGVHTWENTGPIVTGLVQTHAGMEGGAGWG